MSRKVICTYLIADEFEQEEEEYTELIIAHENVNLAVGGWSSVLEN
jgi:hypothetical protein